MGNRKTITKLAIISAIFIFAILFGPRLFVLSTGTWDYLHAEVNCTGTNPTPPPSLGDSFPVPIYEIRPYTVIAGPGWVYHGPVRGPAPMYPGDELQLAGEGDWLGMVTLLWAGKEGAYFLAEFEVNTHGKGYSRDYCRWYLPVGEY